MAQIILIQPLTGSWDEMSIRMPESLLAVASVPVAKGYDVQIIDQRCSRDFNSDIDAAVCENTIIFGITAITGEQIRHALEVTRLVKRRHPTVPVCWGGVHATLLPEQTIAHPMIDFVVVGDGENVFCELFERLRDGLCLDGLHGLLYKKDGEILSSAGRLEVKQNIKGGRYSVSRKDGMADVITDMDCLPPLPYHLLNMDNYSVFDTDDGTRSATLNTSRGCPHCCTFCVDPIINEGIWRGFSAERVLEKVNLLYDTYQVRMIYFQDDYFPGSKQRLLNILKGLEVYARKLLWGTLGIRADSLAALNNEELDLLYRSGCHSLEIGIETGSTRILNMLNKGETLDVMRSTNMRLARYAIKVKYTLIIGFPGETKSEVLETLNFAEELERVNPNAYCLIFNFLPIVNTPFFNEAVSNGFGAPKNLSDWEHMNFDTWMKHYQNWASPSMVAWLQAISFVSYFHNRNVRYKFSGSLLLHIAFICYQPVAAWRFRHRLFGWFIEMKVKNWIFAIKKLL
ncbi:MAG: radical SAM protein [Desulfuromonadaceae bacterium]|nr:radical SAM protein [Desulfuromonadaceae bacterium]MDD2855768.1 radical SAM protein [Desulfuromonadaceae bacterium]